MSSDCRILLHTLLKLLNPLWVPQELSGAKPVTRYKDLAKNMKPKPNDNVIVSGTPAYFGGSPTFALRFRFIAPTLPDLEEVIKNYRPAFESGVITNAKCVARFEETAAAYLGARHCVAVSSCTSGLMLVMRALGLTGEVIVPSFTFFATGHAIRWNSLRPVFADCDRRTWNVDIEDIERKITPQTSAIVAVHMYGNPNDVQALERLAARRGLRLIFDAAHAFGSKYRGMPVGQFGDAEVFSLSPTKLLVAGEGGLVTTNDALLAQNLRVMRNYGDNGSYDPEWIGMNARMSEFNAALALAGLPLLEAKVARRNEMARLYSERLTGLPGLRFQAVHSEDVHTFKDYSIHVAREEFGLDRNGLAAALLAENIETKKYFYPPLHKQKLYKQFKTVDLPGTDFVADHILSLPIYESLSNETIERVAESIHRIHDFYATYLSQSVPVKDAHVSAIA
jgi:dTDP-4-amino-4,6-dideoxygalactose transaminase